MNVKQSYINFFVATLARNTFSATEIHRFLVESWGAENVVSLRRVQQLTKEFAKEQRTLFERKEGSGRPRTSTAEENIIIVREMIEEDCHLSCPAISRVTEIEETSVRRILKRELGKKSLCSRWVPHILTDNNKRIRMTCCQEMLNAYSASKAKEKIIVIDEKWIYFRDVPPKEFNRAWVDGAGDRPTIARRTISDRKVLIIVASNFSKSLTYFEILHDGGSINAVRYLEFLQNMILKFQAILPAGELVIQHDNARPHVANLIRLWLEKNRVSLLKQPAYSPDTNLMDRFIFRNYECYRRGKIFSNSGEVSNDFHQYLESISEANLTGEFQTLTSHLQSVIEADGDYV